jgi:hypothetical protein
MTTNPEPDFTSPLAGRIEVREPCPWCPDRPMIARSLMDQHCAELHPEVQTVEATAAVPPPADRAPSQRAGLRNEIAMSIALRHNGAASDGRGWFRNEEERQGFLADADAMLGVLPEPVDRAAASVKQRADCTELEWAEQERARFERLYTRETVRTDRAEARAAAMERAMESTAADASAHRFCHMRLMSQCQRAERAEAVIAEVRAKHKKRTERHGSGCVQCGIVWPCPTYLTLGVLDPEEPASVVAPQPDTTPAPKPVGYSGKGRVFCIACPHPGGEDVPLTANEVESWELCPSCGRHVVDVATEEQPS